MSEGRMPEKGIRSPRVAAIHTGRASLARLIARTFNRQEVDDILTDAFIRSRDNGGGKPTLRSQSAFLLRTATAIAMNRFSRNGARLNAHTEDLSVPSVAQHVRGFWHDARGHHFVCPDTALGQSLPNLDIFLALEDLATEPKHTSQEASQMCDLVLLRETFIRAIVAQCFR